MYKRKEIKRIMIPKHFLNFSTLKSIESEIMKKFNARYNSNDKNSSYNQLIVNSLIFNKNTHLVAMFKDSMIWDYIDEFFKRFYKKNESYERVPRFASFYKNYLKFFCKPTFANFTVNNLIQEYNEKKAELYYNQNFKSKKKDAENEENEENDEIDDDKNSKTISKSKIEKTIFNDSIKENIENNSIITVKNYMNKNEMTMTLPDNDFNNTIINESGLLNQYSSEQSFILLMNQFKSKNRKTEKDNSGTVLPTSLSKNKKQNCKHSKFISYTNLCQKKNFQVIKQNQKCHTKSQLTFKNSYNRSRNNNANLCNYLSKENPGSSNNNYNNTKFKTFDIINTKQKKNMLKTQNVENIINKINQQVTNNVYPKKKNNFSIDNLISKSQKPESKKKSSSSTGNTNQETKKSTLKSYYIKPKKTVKPPSSNPKQVQNSNTTNDDLMKITLALLMNGSNTTTHKNRLANSGKHIQNVNININNQININSNVQLHETFSPKHLNNKLLRNDKVDMNINSNLNRILNTNNTNNQSSSSNIAQPVNNKKSRNKWGSYDINSSNSKAVGVIYSSYNGIDKKSINTFMTKNATKTTYNNNVSNNLKGKIIKFTSHQMLRTGNKIKVIPRKAKKNIGLQFKTTSAYNNSATISTNNKPGCKNIKGK